MRVLLQSIALWLLLVTLLPLILWQGKRTQKNTPRLPEAQGDHEGFIPGHGEPLRILMLGESTAVGVGVDYLHQGLVGHLTRLFAQDTGRPLHWQLIGQNGATVAELRNRLGAAGAQYFDIAVLAIGVNDAKALRSPRGWRHELGGLLADLHRRQPQARLYLSAMPPLGLFPALPQPLRFVMGIQAARLRQVSEQLVSPLPYARQLHPDFSFAPGLFASDGFHPSEAGYERWAVNLVTAIASSGPQATA
jgi:lysophospholipase L1-like esterase